ncbi:uncharacterized protein LOC117342482 [Pecten maximus]|uniref:uncharacterized protein LOC117342482 n=1 Tax=Pecten maximus TaxID=6579 RepID=UPI00145886A8|nr:uncharacterized protein LOC117342482 [Pecten maximus]
MECNVQKHPVIVFNDEGGSSDKDGTCTSCSRCGSKFLTWTYLVLFLVLFLSNISLHYKCMTLSNELSELQKRDISPRASPYASSNKDSRSVSIHHNQERSLSRRNSRQVRRRRREILNDLERKTERHKSAIERILNRPAMHLRGSSSDAMNAAQNSLFSSIERRNIFVWEHQDPNYPNPSFRYVNDVQDNTKILGINITNPGMYLIYSQVMINGPPRAHDPAYGLETARRKPHNLQDVLLRSHVTQDGRGSVYPNIPNYAPRYPVDFISHMGMFELECEDIIYVRVPSLSSNGNYLRDSEQTYFGLELIKPKYNYLQQLNGC